VNIVGAFALGVLVGAVLGADARRLLGDGLLGAFTTFSTWAFESHRLGEDGRPLLGALNFLVSLAAGLVAAWGGRRLGHLL
jgi:CrcB protein